MRRTLSIALCLVTSVSYAQQTPYEQSGGIASATYKEMMRYYRALDAAHATIKMDEAGASDAAYPLHVVYYSKDANYDVKQWKTEGKVVLLINNGIHPGEPDGVDACMMLLRDAANGKITVPDNVVLAVVPVFNVGGMLNRNSHSRANQNGPEEYGFRGNAQNLDLNRDLMKMDAKETRSLVRLFHKLDPDLFIDNHVSNGADYQHIMTLLTTQHDKLGGVMGSYLNKELEPMIYTDMKQRGYDLVPYVNHWGHAPDKGWVAFHEGPRFASGFAALFHTYGFVTETHMLKPFKQRVDGTYAMMQSFIKLASANAEKIKATRREQKNNYSKQRNSIAIAWQSDTSKQSLITFKGYEAGYKPSAVSGKPRLYYDRNKPYTKVITYYNSYAPKTTVNAPKAYVVPQGWHKVVTRLKDNGVKIRKLDNDTVMQMWAYYIDNYETSPKPYEGHYLHSNVKARKELQQVRMLKGDWIVSTDQDAKRYIIEVLEPTAPDAFFAWGFFDATLQQKEGYSDYVFEDEAAILLNEKPELRKQLEERKKKDAKFANDGEAQLEFVYRNSPYYEPGHMRYPVFRIE